jgi:hypothetical protein
MHTLQTLGVIVVGILVTVHALHVAVDRFAENIGIDVEQNLSAAALRRKLWIVVTIEAGFVIGLLGEADLRAQKSAEQTEQHDRYPQALRCNL